MPPFLGQVLPERTLNLWTPPCSVYLSDLSSPPARRSKTGQWGNNGVLPQALKHLSQCCWINLILYQSKEAPTWHETIWTVWGSIWSLPPSLAPTGPPLYCSTGWCKIMVHFMTEEGSTNKLLGSTLLKHLSTLLPRAFARSSLAMQTFTTSNECCRGLVK